MAEAHTTQSLERAFQRIRIRIVLSWAVPFLIFGLLAILPPLPSYVIILTFLLFGWLIRWGPKPSLPTLSHRDHWYLLAAVIGIGAAYFLISPFSGEVVLVVATVAMVVRIACLDFQAFRHPQLLLDAHAPEPGSVQSGRNGD